MTMTFLTKIRLWLVFSILSAMAAFPAVAQTPGLPSLAATTAPAEASDADNASVQDLIKILENDEARAHLIESLKNSAGDQAGENAAPANMPAEIIQGLPGEVAAYSRGVVALALSVGKNLWDTAGHSLDLMAGVGSLDLPRISSAILPVAVVMIVVFAVLALTRFLKAPLLGRLARRASRSGPFQKLMVLAIAALVDAVAILAAWAVGHVAATIFNGGAPSLNQALFLNAFLLIEGIKLVLNLFVQPNTPGLRLTPFSDRQAKYWYFWISRLISVIGYTFLFLAPIVESNSSYAAARAVRVIVALLSLVTSLILILQNRVWVRDRLARAYDQGDHSVSAQFNWLLGRVWWLIAIVYAVTVFSAWLTSPTRGLEFIVAASLKTIAAMTIGGLVTTLLSWLIAHGIPVPVSAKERLPLLERRINAFIPTLLTVIRVLVVIVVLSVILEAWRLLNFSGWVATTTGQRFIGGLFGAGLVILIGFVVYLVISSWVEYRLNPNFGKVPTARERTLLALFRNGFTITLVVIIAMLVLSQVGIDIGPLLAGAGVVGLAVGFGSQKLVQDIITGAFIQLENAMNEGDVVSVGGVSGVVERLTIRSVALRSLDGTYYLIPFSSVDQVANMTKGFSQFVADLGVAYRENVEDVKIVMRDAFNELQTGEHGPEILGDFEMFGVEKLGDSAVVVRGRIKTLPGKQWGIGRAFNEIVKRLCDERDIEIPFPHMTIWFGENKDGSAPPVRLSRPGADLRAVTQAEPVGDQSDPSRHGSVDREGLPIPPDEDGVGDERG